MDKFYDIYDSANSVASLWIFSAMLPVFIVSPAKIHIAIRLVSALVFLVIAYTLSIYRKNKKELGEWGYSDLIAYILVPLILSGFICFLSIFGDVK